MDIQGVVLVVSGLFLVVYGFAWAETVGWLQVSTLACIGGGIVALLAFVLRQSRTDHPLLPLRVLRDRNRGGALIAVLLAGAAMFGLFLFLTYYLQTGFGYGAVLTGLAFLPMVGTLMFTSITSSQVLAGRVSPRWIISTGMLVAAVGMVLLTRIGVTSSYVGRILPGLVVAGAGIGLVFSSATSNASLGLMVEDQGVGSAMTTVAQQIGGSLGTALLNTLFASAVSTYLLTHGRAGAAAGHAAGAVHGYIVVFLDLGGHLRCWKRSLRARPQELRSAGRSWSRGAARAVSPDPASRVCPLRKDAARNRAALLASGEELIAIRGVGVTLDEIAVQAGLNVATAYGTCRTNRS